MALVSVLGTGQLVASPASASCDLLSIPSLGMRRCVVSGGQTEIDAGSVVRVTRLSSASVDWLAGHRTSHGATFSDLPELQMDAQVEYGGTVYRVVEHRLVDRTRPRTVYDLLSAEEPTVVLQTSAYGNFVHVWRAVGEAAPPAAPPTSEVTPTKSTVDVRGPVTTPIGDPVGVSLVAPVRILDTRVTGQRLQATRTRVVTIPAPVDLPADATVAFVNFTAIAVGRAGYVAAFACSDAPPETSNVNWTEHTVAVANLVVVPVADRTFCIRASSDVDAAVDLVGYGSPSAAWGFTASPGERLLDTRTAGSRIMQAHETRRVEVGGAPSGPAARAVEVSLTGLSPELGFFSVHPCDDRSGTTSTLNPVPGHWTANTTMVTLDEQNGFCVSSHFVRDAEVHLVVDLHGTFADGGAQFQRLRPVRLVDTRRFDSSDMHQGAAGSVTNARIDFPGSIWRGLPLTEGLVVNVTTTDVAEPGFVTVWQCDDPRPNTSIQNPRAGYTTASMSSVGSVSGDVCVQSLRPVHLVVDAFGAWVDR